MDVTQLNRRRFIGYSALAAALLPAEFSFSSPALAAQSESGLRLSQIDKRRSAGTDFYGYANGLWHDKVVFEGNVTYAGARSDLIALRKSRIKEIVDSAARDDGTGEVSRIVGPFYSSFLDVDAIDSAGLKPAEPDLKRIFAIRSKLDLLDMFADSYSTGLPTAIGGSIFYDFHAPGWLRFTLTPDGTGLPQRELYLDSSEQSLKTRAGYRAFVVDILRLAKQSQCERKAEAIIALEAKIAELSWPTAEARNRIKTANLRTRDELKAMMPNIDWDRYLQRAGVGQAETFIVEQPDAMPKLDQLIADTPLSTWRSWALLHYLTNNAPYLSTSFARCRFAFFEQELFGQREEGPRWQRGIELVERFFGDALGQLYVERYFPENSRQIVSRMFDDIKTVMRERIVKAVWMSATTKAEALKKVDTINVKIGYPNRWPEYGSLKFDPKDFYGNLNKARKRAWNDRAELVKARLPRDRWMTTAQTSGAAANPNLNEITVPAGALEPPYFNAKADAAVNYGAIGAIIGHELSHLFDQLGRQMDATGKLRDWWTSEDAARYEAVAARVVEQYDTVEIAGVGKVSGATTLNENIADIAGLEIAFEAWQRSLGGKPSPTLDGYSGEQRFFLAFAQMRAGKMTAAMMRQQLASGPHAPDEVRGNQPMRNNEAWYRAFNVTPKDPLYISPEKRAIFW